MTAQRDVKKLIRDRQTKTKESYSAARMHVMNERAALLAPELSTGPSNVEAIVIKVNQGGSARVRILGEPGEVTFRSADLHEAVPGHVARLVIEKRWPWLGDAYASGKVHDVRVDVSKLGLTPLR